MKSNFIGIVSKLREAASSAGQLEVHIITPGWGSSGYYPESVLQKAVADKVYHAGMHMGWDHPTSQEEFERPERSLSTLAGVITQDAWYEAEGWDGPGIYSTAKPFPDFADSIAAMGDYIGVSHNVYGDGEWGKVGDKEGTIITEIYADDFNSVDFVTLPGAGGHYQTVFAEAAKRLSDNDPATPSAGPKEGGNSMVTLTLEEVKKDTKIMEAIKAEIMKEADSEKLAEKLTEAQKENKTLAESLKEAKSKLVIQEGRTYALSKVAESKLPAPSQARVVESVALGEIPQKDDALDTAEFDKAIEAAIKAETEYIDSILKESGAGGVHDLGRKKSESDDSDAKAAYKESLIRAGFNPEDAKAMAGEE